MNITKLILHIRDCALWKWHGIDSYRAINAGWCMDFAVEISAILTDKLSNEHAIWGDNVPIEHWRNPLGLSHSELTFGHCFIWYNGKFYDSECPEGVDYPDDLPFYKRELEYYIEHSDMTCEGCCQGNVTVKFNRKTEQYLCPVCLED